jgi:dolichol-phosphate mannosyltransferase
VGLFALYHRLLTGEAIPGWTSQLCVAAFFGMINALGVGILGEYVFRIYDQVRGRPLFIVREQGSVPGRRATGDSVKETSTLSAAPRRRMLTCDTVEPSVVGGEPG